MNTTTEPKLYNIQSHGIDNEEYFRGVETIHTQFTQVITGTGDTEAEAYNDVVDQIAWAFGDEVLGALGLPDFWGDDEHDVCQECDYNSAIPGCDQDCEQHYYVSILFNVVQ